MPVDSVWISLSYLWTVRKVATIRQNIFPNTPETGVFIYECETIRGHKKTPPKLFQQSRGLTETPTLARRDGYGKAYRYKGKTRAG